MEKIGSGIRDKHPASVTLILNKIVGQGSFWRISIRIFSATD
jgi:hypothetical protein